MTALRRPRAALLLVLPALLLVTFPLYGGDFLVVQIAIQSMWLGIIAMSLIFLAGYGGMVSLAQTTLYGLAAYAIGISSVRLGQPWYVAVPAALATATLGAFIVGLIAVRTQGIYFLMITLAMAMVIFYLANQNYTVFGGHTGINGVRAPALWGVSFRDPTAFYYLALACAIATWGGLRYLVRSPFGLALQGIRDNPRRMRALGYWVEAHRVGAFTVAGLVAGIGGILGAWYNGAISPSYIDLARIVNVLVIAVIGGMVYLEGAFLGALAFTLVNNFASSYTERYNTVIGLTFLLIVLFSPNGLLGLAHWFLDLRRIGRRPAAGAEEPPSAEPALPTAPTKGETV